MAAPASSILNMNGLKIQSVAAGTLSTDAINLGQLTAATSGLPTGTGVNGRVALWSGTSSLNADAGLTFTSGTLTVKTNLSVGDSSARGYAKVWNDSNSTNYAGTGQEEQIQLQNRNNTTNNWSGLSSYSSGGAIDAGIGFQHVNHAAHYADITFFNRGSGGFSENFRIKSDRSVIIQGLAGTGNTRFTTLLNSGALATLTPASNAIPFHNQSTVPSIDGGFIYEDSVGRMTIGRGTTTSGIRSSGPVNVEVGMQPLASGEYTNALTCGITLGPTTGGTGDVNINSFQANLTLNNTGTSSGVYGFGGRSAVYSNAGNKAVIAAGFGVGGNNYSSALSQFYGLYGRIDENADSSVSLSSRSTMRFDLYKSPGAVFTAHSGRGIHVGMKDFTGGRWSSGEAILAEVEQVRDGIAIYGSTYNSVGTGNKSWGINVIQRVAGAGVTVTEAYGINLSLVESFGGVMSWYRGIVLNNAITTGGPTYLLYSSLAAARSWHQGPVSIGVDEITAKLRVRGAGSTSSTPTAIFESSAGTGASFVIRDDGRVAVGRTFNSLDSQFTVNAQAGYSDGYELFKVMDNSTTNVFSIMPRSTFNLTEIMVGNPGTTGNNLVRWWGSTQGSTLARMDFNVTSIFLQSLFAQGTVQLNRKGDASGGSNQFASQDLSWQYSLWNGSAAESRSFRASVIPLASGIGEFTLTREALGGAQSDVMKIRTDNGNVGLGVSPTANLDVNGTLRFRAFGSANFLLGLADSSGNVTSFSPATVLSSGGGFVNGGNSFGTTATLGTNDTNALRFETNAVVRSEISSQGSWLLTMPAAELFTLDYSAAASGTNTYGLVLKNQLGGASIAQFLTLQDSAGSAVFYGQNRNSSTIFTQTGTRLTRFTNGTGNFEISVNEGVWAFRSDFALTFPSLSSDPASPSNNTLWLGNSGARFKHRTSGVTRTFANVEDDLTGSYDAITATTYTVSGNVRTVRLDASSNAITVTIGSGLQEGRDYVIACRNNSTNIVTLSAESTYTFQLSGTGGTATSILSGNGSANNRVYLMRRFGTTIFVI